MRGFLVALISSLLLAAPAGAEPQANMLLKQIGFSEDEARLMLETRLVEKTLESTSDREVATGMGFFAEVDPDDLIRILRRDSLNRLPDTLASGSFWRSTKPDDLAALLSSDAVAEEQAKLWRNATPGHDLNLSMSEILALRAARKQIDSGSLVREVESQIRQLLLNRFEAYREEGLDGIEPYERGGGRKTSVADDLKKAVEALSDLQMEAPGIYTLLGGKPDDEPEDAEDGYRPDESEDLFDWSSIEADGGPVFVLTHRAFARENELFVLLQRQYYVSRGYDSAQSVVALFPYQPSCEEIGRSLYRSSGCPRARPRPGSLLIYVNRKSSKSTDDPKGMGNTREHSIGTQPMEKPFKELFSKLAEWAKPQR